MRFTAILPVVGAVLLTGCSFIGVKGPSQTEPYDSAGHPLDPKSIRCTDSDLLPAVDALGGAAALAVAGGGVIIEHTSDDGSPQHFTAYYMTPLIAVAIAYFWAGSWGTDRVSRCVDLKEATTKITPILEIDSGKKPGIEIDKK